MSQAGAPVQDQPTEAFIAEMERQFPTEPETAALLVRKLRRRVNDQEPYKAPTLQQMEECIRSFLDVNVDGPYEVGEPRWLAGGASKLQVVFDLDWRPEGELRHDRVVVRFDPAESHNATSRLREAELLRAVQDTVPVPEVYFVDVLGKWFPEPALLYSFAEGVTKPTTTTTGAVSGLGTHFPPSLRDALAPQFVDHLAAIHSHPLDTNTFTTITPPTVGTTEAAQLQLNRARRIWEEDRAESNPLLEVAAQWLERNLPTMDRPSIVHGDFRSGNFMFDEESAVITAWLDWERGHVGDRHRDLAWTTQAMFGVPKEDGDGYYVAGLIDEDEFYRRYEERSGLAVDPDRLRWYTILNCYQVVVTCLGSIYRVVHLGKNHQPALMVVLKHEAALSADRLQRLMREVI